MLCAPTMGYSGKRKNRGVKTHSLIRKYSNRTNPAEKELKNSYSAGYFFQFDKLGFV